MLAGAPLASVVKVIQTRCSGPLVWQLSIMSILNGSLWVAYGLVTPVHLRSQCWSSILIRQSHNQTSSCSQIYQCSILASSLTMLRALLPSQP